MPGCNPPCVTTFSGTDRQKWNYVKNLYQPSYQIDLDGDVVDSRSASDPARLNDEAKYNAQYAEDHANWSLNYSHIAFEKWLQWQFETGTIVYGNLPQHKRNEHVGHCWMPCPYSNDSQTERSETMLGFDPGTKNDHGIYYMKTASKGARRWGFECTYDGCPYYTTNGRRYFYT